MKEEVDALLKALSESGCQGAEAAMPALLGAIKKPIDENQILTALGSLRGQCCFGLMKEIANQVIEVAGEAPVPPLCPEMRITSALALATPAAIVPTPEDATSLTVTLQRGLICLRS